MLYVCLCRAGWSLEHWVSEGKEGDPGRAEKSFMHVFKLLEIN